MAIIGTELKILYLESEKFLEIEDDRKLIFRLFLNDEDDLTLSFWTAAGTDYDQPEVTLLIGEKSGFKWEGNTFFGDQKIGSNKVVRIKTEIENTGRPHVIFVPKKHNNLPNQIAYEVLVGTITKMTAKETFTSMGFTNPSPPRNSRVKE